MKKVLVLLALKVRENFLRGFDHVMRQKETKSVSVVIKMNVDRKSGRGKLEQRWLNTIENDMRAAFVCLKNRDKWRSRTKVAHPKLLVGW